MSSFISLTLEKHVLKKKSYGGEGKTGLSARLVSKLAYGEEQ